MRNKFAQIITKHAVDDSRVVLLSGDIGNRLFDPLKEKCPEQFINCGVAESNMISMAAGMALGGLRPVVYTIATFLIYRPYEQIRIDLGYHDLPVVLVGVGGGLCYAQNGPTHHAVEDIAVMRAIPNMQVVCPGDSYEVEAALSAALKSEHPTYIRLGKKGEPNIHADTLKKFKIGKADLVQTGVDVVILATGNMLDMAMQVAYRLKMESAQVAVYSFHTVKPLDECALTHCFKNYPLVCTLEEHTTVGGFGAAIAEWVCDRQLTEKAILKRFALPDSFFDEAGEHAYAREVRCMKAPQIADEILNTLQTLTLNKPVS